MYVEVLFFNFKLEIIFRVNNDLGVPGDNEGLLS